MDTKENNRRKLEHWKIMAACLMICDVISVCLAYFLALWLRFDCIYSHIPQYYRIAYALFILPYALAAVGIFWAFHMYRGMWRYAGYSELVRTFVGSITASIVHSVAITLIFDPFPLSYYIWGAGTQFVLLLIPRFAYRILLFYKVAAFKNAENVSRVMLIGAGQAGQMILEELQAADPHLYIKFPSKASNTLAAARCRTIDLIKRYQRRFTVLHLTDIHGDMDSTQAAYAYADHIGADLVALTGDCVVNHWYHGCNILHTIIRNAKTPTVYSLGNHDVAGRTDQQVYDQSIEPIRDVLQASEKHAYYYRDFCTEGETVRVISLYPFRYDAKQRVMGYYTEEQLLWLCETMASTPDGGHIFILRHFSHRKPVMPEGEAAMFYDYNDSSDSEYSWLNMGSDPVKDIVDAYNNKAEIYAQYSGNLKDDAVETVTVKYDFTNRPTSEFVAYFTGHVHIDHMGYARDTRTPQVVLGSLCTTGVKGSEDYSAFTSLSTPRDYGTDSQIAFNVFTFDFQKKKIYVARVGNNMFKDREKTWTELSYSE